MRIKCLHRSHLHVRPGSVDLVNVFDKVDVCIDSKSMPPVIDKSPKDLASRAVSEDGGRDVPQGMQNVQ